MTEPPISERDLQRRWAERDWPAPFLDAPEGRVRIISPGRWNHGPGPDFRDAQMLDADGRARRGDVELHLTARGWIEHGHDHDPAYDGVLLHVVAPPAPNGASREGMSDGSGHGADHGAEHGAKHVAGGADARIPAQTPLPSAAQMPAAVIPGRRELPCTDLVTQAGAAVVNARLEQIAQRRFWRKASALRALDVPDGIGAVGGTTGRADRLAVLAAARALGQPHNAEHCQRAAAAALARASSWREVRVEIDRAGWRPGRGALGSAAGCAELINTLLQRWLADGSRPAASFLALAVRPPADAAAALQVPRRLGPARARQLLADAVYPFAAAIPMSRGETAQRALSHWCALPGARYLRTAELRERLTVEGPRRVRWKHPQTQALLELEQSRCRQAACRICPLAALRR